MGNAGGGYGELAGSSATGGHFEACVGDADGWGVFRLRFRPYCVPVLHRHLNSPRVSGQAVRIPGQQHSEPAVVGGRVG